MKIVCLDCRKPVDVDDKYVNMSFNCTHCNAENIPEVFDLDDPPYHKFSYVHTKTPAGDTYYGQCQNNECDGHKSYKNAPLGNVVPGVDLELTKARLDRTDCHLCGTSNRILWRVP